MLPLTIKTADFIRCDREFIAKSSIVWLEGDWNYTRIHRQDKAVNISAYSLKWYERQLGGFVRVSKSAMINPQHVHEVIKPSNQPGRLQLMLSNGISVDVARRRQAETKRRLNLILNVNCRRVY